MSGYKHLRYLILPCLYLLVGGLATAMLVQRVLYYAEVSWLVLLLPMVMVSVLLFVVGMVNVWLQYRSWKEEGLLVEYSERSLLGLYIRCWAVVISGLTLGVLFAWMYQLLPNYLQELFHTFKLLFYGICTFLTCAALMSIVLGENLQETRLRQAQSENQLLKAQLNPHFLYNTLNNIDALIWLDQERASSAVTSLSSLMRYMTYSARQEQVPLADEVKALQQLCELQRLRMSGPDSLRLEVPVQSKLQLQVAPLLLLPLVENCFKHCGATNEPNAISIQLTVVGNKVFFSTDNNLPAEPREEAKGSAHGVGLTVLRRRLDLLYPKHYSFSAQREGDRFRTRLTVSC